jgi:hypothetical protein
MLASPEGEANLELDSNGSRGGAIGSAFGQLAEWLCEHGWTNTRFGEAGGASREDSALLFRKGRTLKRWSGVCVLMLSLSVFVRPTVSTATACGKRVK